MRRAKLYFVTDKDKQNKFKGLFVLGIIWLVGALADRLWIALDDSIPAWDQADYLTGSLNYWQALQHPQWLLSEWWESLWLLSSKVPPFTYIAAAVVQNFFGTGPDQATLVQLMFSAVLLGSIYGLGTQLFGVQVGLWAAILSQLIPGLYRLRLDFLLDYPLAAVVTLSFYCLTVWRDTATLKIQLRGWFWAATFGLSLGLAMMVKQTAVFFMLTPILWVLAGTIRHCLWGRLTQLMLSFFLSIWVFGPWYRTNWLFMLTAGKRATVDSAIAEGDPALNTLDAWIYYWKILPYHLTWPLLIVSIVGFLLYFIKNFKLSTQDRNASVFNSSFLAFNSLRWLTVFWIGSYLLCSLNINKDERYILPLLPVTSVFLAYGLTLLPTRWGKQIRWGTVGLAIVLMFLNLFPVGGVLGNYLTQTLSPYAQHPVYMGTEWPHQLVIDEIIQTEPNLRSTLGVLPSTAEVNQHNLNYYGALRKFQVYGRQVGTRRMQVAADARSLSWFLTKTGNQGSVPQEAQATMVQIIEQGPDFQLRKIWNIPDGSVLKLYHQKTPPIQVQPLSEPQTQVKLERVIVPEKAPPGVPLPVTYEWTGAGEPLQSGLVVLTWRMSPLNAESQKSQIHRRASGFPQGNLQSAWLHDHGIGLGTLQLKVPTVKSSGGFRVVEQLSMLPPADTSAGAYTLEATYLNRQTGETYPIPVPPVTLTIAPNAVPIPAPELDLITQLRTLSAELPKGTNALGPVFEEVGRINQYDPIQDYLIQAQQSLDYRLQLEPQNLHWTYALVLSLALKKNVKQTITTLEKVVQLDAQNPYAYAYLAVVHLYNGNPTAAQKSLKPALAINPNLPELKVLEGVAALMQGNLVKAWQTWKKFN